VRFELEIEIARPPEDVYAYLADPRNLADWQEEVAEVRGATGEPLPAGAAFTEVRTFLGKRIESEIEVIGSDPGREYSLRSRTGPVRFSVRHLLEPAGAGTRLRLVGEADPGKLFGVAGPLLRRAAERRTKADFRRLKAVLETRRE
jgi:carbon monoxide dehydrogenase subunit G